MCDSETRERLQRIEISLGVLSTDVVWLKRISIMLMTLLFAFFGLNAHVIGL